MSNLSNLGTFMKQNLILYYYVKCRAAYELCHIHFTQITVRERGLCLIEEAELAAVSLPFFLCCVVTRVAMTTASSFPRQTSSSSVDHITGQNNASSCMDL